MKESDKKNNFLLLDKEYSLYKNSKIVLFPVSYIGVKNSTSKGAAVEEIIKASRNLEVYDEEQGKQLAIEQGICTLTGLNISPKSLKSFDEKIYKSASQLVADKKFIVTVSENHSASFEVIKSYSEHHKNLSILHLDSKANMKNGDEAESSHDSLFYRIFEFNSNIVQVGVRSMSKRENEFRKEKKIKQFLAPEIKLGMYGIDWQEIVEKNLSDNVYVTIDLSVFDPSVFPNVEYPEPGGLLWNEILYLLKIIGLGKTVVGFDVCGLRPNKSNISPNYFVAKLIYKFLNYAL
jgi:agmatinase